jgi:chemotaxis protein methyltransferase WspC
VPAPATAYSTIGDVRALADAGRLREAAEAGARLRERDGGSAELLFLLAVVAEAAGDARGAEEFLRKTLYLEPGHAEALAHLALLAEKQGDLRGARTLRQRAQRALERGAA